MPETTEAVTADSSQAVTSEQITSLLDSIAELENSVNALKQSTDAVSNDLAEFPTTIQVDNSEPFEVVNTYLSSFPAYFLCLVVLLASIFGAILWHTFRSK